MRICFETEIEYSDWPFFQYIGAVDSSLPLNPVGCSYLASSGYSLFTIKQRRFSILKCHWADYFSDCLFNSIVNSEANDPATISIEVTSFPPSRRSSTSGHGCKTSKRANTWTSKCIASVSKPCQQQALNIGSCLPIRTSPNGHV